MSDETPPFSWRIGEHVTVIGDTGTGKTYLLAKSLLRLRQYVVVFVTKSDPDDTRLWKEAGFHFIRHAKEIDDARYSRFVLQPRYSQQAIEGWRLSERVYRQGRWTIVYDEFLLAERLGLREQIERLLTQGRSDGITVVVGEQRPVQTSRFAITSSTHVFAFRQDGRDAKTISESTFSRVLPLLDERYATPQVPALSGHDFAYIHRGKRFVGRGNARALGRLLVPGGRRKNASETA